MKKDLLTIIKHYGIENQLKYIHSEYFELDEAILKFENHDFANWTASKNMFTKDIAEEIADVMVMLKQFQYYYDIEEEDIEAIMKKKIDRQLKRMEEEK